VPSRLRVAAAVPLVAAIVGVVVAGSARAENAVATVDPTAPPVTVVGPATLTLSVSARTAAPKANVPASVRLVAPGGQGVAGAYVTVWMTPPTRPTLHIAAARVRTDATGSARLRLRMSVTERISASASYPGQPLASGAQLAAGTVTAPQVATVRVVVPPATRVLALAAALRGRPYVWGAAGPRRFDCSGFTMYVMAHAVGRHLPHSAAAQYALSRHEAKSSIRPGDLVFFLHGSHAYHVAIYAGHGLMWHAPHPGDHVRLAPISSSSWAAGRVI
jgi:cell wall-associated NlpC family hydrolase